MITRIRRHPLDFMLILAAAGVVAYILFRAVAVLGQEAGEPTWRQESYTKAGLQEVRELQEVSGAVQFRRYDGRRALLEQRPADAVEQMTYAAFRAQLVTDTARQDLQALRTAIAGRVSALNNCADNWLTLTPLQQQQCLRVTMSDLADLMEATGKLLLVTKAAD